jgi:arylsulfatase A-like enzyme
VKLQVWATTVVFTHLFAAAAWDVSAAPARLPNIIVVLVDDAGYADFPYFGDERPRTPHIDRLCDEGIRFTQFYANAPICSPSRAAWITGQYPARWGITSFIASRQENAQREMRNWLDPAARSLARILQSAGYATGHFGKWHLGGGRDVGEAPLITDYGFDESLTQFEGLGDRVLPLVDSRDGASQEQLPLGIASEQLGRGETTWADRRAITGVLVNRAIEFIQSASAEGQPFYINVWPDDVHTPLFPPKELQGDGSKRELYLGVLENMDRQLGMLFDFIRQSEKLRDNTLIIVASDNGCEPGAGSAGKLRGAKGNLYEGGVRSPLVVWGPGMLAKAAAGTTNEQTVLSSIDVAESLLSIAATETPSSVELDGEDLSRSLLGVEQQTRATPLFWSRPPDRAQIDGQAMPDLAVRDGAWKLLVEFDGGAPQLYDLAADPNETANLAEQHPQIVCDLRTKALAWHAETSARLEPDQSRKAKMQSANRPNIVVILADDLGFSDVGCYGSEIATPNIDRLAARGVRFREFYNNARCCPSRAALMTGRYPHQVGVGAMIDGYATWIREAADRPSYGDHLSRQTPTIAEVLRTAGYRTLMSGKWHLGARQAEWPAQRGFDRSFALIPGAMNYFGGETNGPRVNLALNGESFAPPQDGFFATDEFTDQGIEFLGEARQVAQPFFLYMAYNAPHWPLHAPPEDIAKYTGVYDGGWQAIRKARFKRMLELGVVDESIRMAPMDRGDVNPWNELADPERAEWARRMEIYAAQVTRMDDNIGRLLEELERSGVADNTLVMLLSDNGGAAEDPHRGQPGAELGSRDSFWGYGRPWATVSNTPWRRHKVTAYEGGISGPAIACWPGGVPTEARGKFVDGPAHLMDLAPTFLELAGLDDSSPDGAPFEGRPIVDMIQGKSAPADRTLCWEHEGNRAIRKGRWKLVMLANLKSGWELYDIDADRTESTNLAATHPEVVREFAAEYQAWAERCGVVAWDEIEKRRPEASAAK